MKKKELLSPAGDMESLKQAIHNGADAVYLAMTSFGARKFAENFDVIKILEAIKLCHLYGVKIYVTMNTLVKEKEVDSFLKQVEFLHTNGVDAIIMQDFGMISLVRRMYPNLEIHASTQANNSSIETIEMFYKMGVKRVVVSRELSLDEIQKIKFPIEIEVFIHGALCISYSGNCLMSAMTSKRSGNRGECAGSCRLKYALKEGKRMSPYRYLLSTKELNTTKRLQELITSKIKSFKIEGRMKSPEYVGFVTRFYRSILDQKELSLEEETEKLKVLFNRKFTEGNLFQATDFMNINSPNHIGIEIGKVLEVDDHYIKIKLKKELHQEDGIRFLESKRGMIVNYLYDKDKKLTNKLSNIGYISNRVGLKTNDRIYKTIDKKLTSFLKQYELKKIPICIEVIAKVGEKLKIRLSDQKETVEKEGTLIDQAKTQPLSKERIRKQLEKLGNTPFLCEEIKIQMDSNIFIPMKELNTLRRYLIEELIRKRENDKKEVVKKEVTFPKINYQEEFGFCATCYSEEQLKKCLSLGCKRIYVKERNLYEKYQEEPSVYYFVERNSLEIEKRLEQKSLVSEYLLPKSNKKIVGNYFLNVYNSYTAYYLLQNGFQNICLSTELTTEEQIEIIEKMKERFQISFTPEILVYGRVENMLIKGNILNLTEGINKYSLIDLQQREFPVYLKSNHLYLLDSKVQRKQITEKKIVKRFDFYEESAEEIERIVKE